MRKHMASAGHLWAKGSAGCVQHSPLSGWWWWWDTNDVAPSCTPNSSSPSTSQPVRNQGCLKCPLMFSPMDNCPIYFFFLAGDEGRKCRRDPILWCFGTWCCFNNNKNKILRKKKLQYISMFLRLVGKKRPSGPSGISKDNVYWAPVLKKNLSHAESAQLRELMAGEGKQAPRLVSHQNLIKISMSVEMCSLMR